MAETKTVFVKNLSFSTGERELEVLFNEEIGKLKSVRIVRNSANQ